MTSAPAIDISRDFGCTRIILRGDLTGTTRFDLVAAPLAGPVIFDLAFVTGLSVRGGQAWCELLRRITDRVVLRACSVPFIVRACVMPELLGHATVVTFFAPYRCRTCDRHDECLLSTAAIVARNFEPPVFRCSCKRGILELDGPAERYLGFLDDESTETGVACA
jgi:hypothetical protein